MMNKTNIHITVTRNGYLDNEYYTTKARQERLQAVLGAGFGMLGGLVGLAAHIGSKLAREFRLVMFLIHLDLYDRAHGTHLRHEYFQNKRAGEISQLRAQF